MALLEFPAELPIPQELPTQSAERRVLSPEGGLFEVRVGQTDRKAYEDYSFPPYSPTRAEALDYFWRVTLNKGGKWFSTPTGRHWPRPEGWIAATRRFVGPPAWEYIHTGKAEGGYWRVTGVFEVRGVGELPVTEDPSAWNPLDIISASPLPPCVDLTEGTRLATRNTIAPDQWEAGVRGEQSRGGTPGERWYLELEIVSVGAPGETQNLQIGLVDDRASNVLSRPPDPSDASEITNLSVPDANYLLAYSRFDGVIFASEPLATSEVGDFGSAPNPGDIYGFDWLVGTSITVTRNGAGEIIVPLTFNGQLFPYFSAGQTLVNGANDDGTGESCRIRTGRRQQSYRPSGAQNWG